MRYNTGMDTSSRSAGNTPSDPMQIGTARVSRSVALFVDSLEHLPYPSILELGTKRSDPNFPTHHREWHPEAGWTMADAEDGTDVDIVTNAHDMREQFADESFDAVIAVSVWEHLERPWVAAKEVERVLAKGGIVYIATHQTFPIHGYPSDFFRFSDKALTLIFEDAGLEVISADYSYPAKIQPPPEVTRWNHAAPAYLNVDLYARKPG